MSIQDNNEAIADGKAGGLQVEPFDDDTSGYPAESFATAAVSGSAGDATVYLENDLFSKTSAGTSASLQTTIMTGTTESESPMAERKVPYDGEDDPLNVKQMGVEVTDKILAHFGSLSSDPSSSTGQKKLPETLATRRWKMAYQYVQKTNAMKRVELSTPIGTGARLHGHALGVLSIESELRRILFDLLYNEKAEYILLGLVLSHLFVLILRAEHVYVTRFHPTKDSLIAADLAITIIYTIECVCRIITLGLYRGPHAYLQNTFNKLDFVIVVDSWVHIIRTYILGQDLLVRLAVLRIFRALLVLRNFSFVGDIFAILDAIRKCLGALERFMVLTIMFLSFFALLGVQFFGGAFHSRCERIYDREPTYPPRLCHRGYDPSGPGWLSPDSDNCNHGDMSADICLFSSNPNYGATHFDNFASSLLIVFQVLTFEGWSLIRKWGNNTTGLGGDAYFIVLIITGGYFLVNIYVAVISGVFLKVRHEHQVLLKRYRRDKSLSLANAIQMASVLKEVIWSDDAKLSWMQRLRRRSKRLSSKFTESFSRQGTRLRRTMSRAVDWNDPNSYMKRISSFGLTGIDDLADVAPEDPALPRSISRNLSRNLSYAARFGRTLSRSLSLTGQRLSLRISAKCWMIVHSKVFRYGVLFFITVNMAGLCSLKAKMTRRHSDNIHNLEVALLVIFGVELLIRFLAGGITGFVEERMNVIDLVVVVLSYWNTGPNRRFLNLTPIRMLRWFYVKRSRRIRRGGEEVPILVAILRSVGHLSAVYCFLFIVIIIFSVFSMELWGGQMNFDDGYPRANHDSFGQAILLWFTVTTGESWVNYMWDAMRPGVRNRWVAPFVFVFYFILTSFIVLNLIIATILEETELTDNQKKYIQKKEHLKWLQTKHYHHLSSTRHSDWIIDAVESAQKGFMDVRRRMTSMSVSRMSIFPSSPSESSDLLASLQRQPTDNSINEGSSTGGPQTSTPPSEEAMIPTKRASYSRVEVPGSAADEGTSKAKIARRSSAGAAPASVQAPVRRRVSQEFDPLLVRSGFKGTNIVEAENRTALQSALLAVVDEQAKVAAATSAKPMEDRAKPGTTTAAAARIPSIAGTSGRVSFVLSDFEALPTFVVRAVPWWMNDRSLFLFQPDNSVRVRCIIILEHKGYRCYEICFLILGAWCFFNNRPRGPFLHNQKDAIVDLTYTFCIFLDILLKVVAYGFLFTREAFMSDPFNWIDIVVLFFSAMKYKILDETTDWRAAWNKVATGCMAILPLTIIGRFLGIRSLMTNVMRTMPVVGQVFVFIVVIYAIFAVIGIQLYANRFRSCTDPSVEGHNDCTGLFRNEVGIMAVRTWVNPSFHFDNFGEAMLSLFVGSTFDSWPENFLFTAMDMAHEPELQPQRNISPSHALYFVTFMCVGGFFILRMFVGVFIDQFGIISGSKLLTERQKLWRDTNRLIQGLSPKIVPSEPSDNRLRRFCFLLVYTRRFELTVVFVILVNYLYMTSRHVTSDANIPQDMYDDGGKNSAIETMFVCVYALEAALKLLGTRFPDWWDDKWNVTELSMVIISASCLYPGLTLYKHSRHVPDLPGIPGMVLVKYPPRQYLGAAFIFVRIFRIIRYFPGLKNMLTTIMIALPSMLDTMALMFIWVIIFSTMGNFFFQEVKSGVCLTNLAGPNFVSMSSSFSILVQMMTLDNWSCMLIDITVQPPYCSPHNDCGRPVGGIIYMLFAVALTTYIFANVFVAQILDTVTFGLISEDALLTPTHVIAFQAQWSQKKYDPKCTGYIGQHKLKEFLIDLGSPLGGTKRANFSKWYTRIEFEVFHFRNEKGIAFRPLLETVCLYKVGPRGLELPVRIERERQIHSIYQKGAVRRIQALVRGFLQRRRNKRGQSDLSAEKPPPTDDSHQDSASSSYIYSDKSAESTLASDDEGSQGAQGAGAASSIYDTPMSHTPSNETESVTTEIVGAEP